MTVKCDDKKCIYSENGMCTNEEVFHKVTEDPIPCITFMKNTPFTFTLCFAKKERECEYCDNSKQLIAREFPHVMYGEIVYDNEWQIIVDRGYIRLCNTDDMQCLDHGEKIKIKYCPMCGKKL